MLWHLIDDKGRRRYNNRRSSRENMAFSQCQDPRVKLLDLNLIIPRIGCHCTTMWEVHCNIFSVDTAVSFKGF